MTEKELLAAIKPIISKLEADEGATDHTILNEYVIPILNIWGWHKVKRSYRVKRQTADAVFFTDEDSFVANTPALVLEVVGRGQGLSPYFNDISPSTAMVMRMKHFHKHKGIEKGILTNGIEWQFFNIKSREDERVLNFSEIVNGSRGVAEAEMFLLGLTQGNYEFR